MRRAAVCSALALAVLSALVPAPANAAGRRRATDCADAAPEPGPGTLSPFRPPAPKALDLNAEGKVLYRQGKWEEARAKYRAAQAADADFLPATLNIACSYVRQERFDEATREVLKLLESGGHVPWAREILEAADLGALKVQPQMKQVRAAMAASATRWGADLSESVLFVARRKPALNVPATGQGVFILALQQEVYAWSPRTRRYRQLTTEDGRVVAMARSSDGRRLLYVTAEKLVRDGEGKVSLRQVALHELTLATMAAGPAVAIPGDVRRLEIAQAGQEFLLRLEGGQGEGTHTLTAGRLVAVKARFPRNAASTISLTGRGIEPAHGAQPLPGRCAGTFRAAKGPSGVPALEVRMAGGKPFRLEAGAGAGLAGLAMP